MMSAVSAGVGSRCPAAPIRRPGNRAGCRMGRAQGGLGSVRRHRCTDNRGEAAPAGSASPVPYASWWHREARTPPPTAPTWEAAVPRGRPSIRIAGRIDCFPRREAGTRSRRTGWRGSPPEIVTPSCMRASLRLRTGGNRQNRRRSIDLW